MSSACGFASKQGKFTIKLSHKLLKLQLPYRIDNEPSNMIVQEFIKHMYNFKPEFSAKDFFTVDLSVLFRILGSVLTYVVLLIQLEN